jgi:hypothetical protein
MKARKLAQRDAQQIPEIIAAELRGRKSVRLDAEPFLDVIEAVALRGGRNAECAHRLIEAGDIAS